MSGSVQSYNTCQRFITPHPHDSPLSFRVEEEDGDGGVVLELLHYVFALATLVESDILDVIDIERLYNNCNTLAPNQERILLAHC